MKVSDLPQLARAVQQRWDFPDQLYKILPLELTQIITARDPATKQHAYSARDRIAAARVLNQMHLANLRVDPNVPQPVPQTSVTHNTQQNIFVVTEANMEDVRAQLLRRASRLSDHSAGPAGRAGTD
jgi:hypothetical protein